MSISNLIKGKKPKPLESFQLNKISKIFLLPIYHLIHKNIIFGYIHKRFIKNFKYKKFSFSLRDIKLPTSSYACFLFKTYEINDRVLVEKHITKKNKSIIIGGGIGFIGTIAYFLSKNKVLVFEINKEIINTLKENLIQNKVLFECIEMNLVLKHIEKKYYYPGDNFLGTSAYVKQGEKLPMNNILFSEIKNIEEYNTLIIDAEGAEEHYISNINILKNIRYLIFEFHFNILDNKKKNALFKVLEDNNFYLEDKFLNSYYFKKK